MLESSQADEEVIVGEEGGSEGQGEEEDEEEEEQEGDDDGEEDLAEAIPPRAPGQAVVVQPRVKGAGKGGKGAARVVQPSGGPGLEGNFFFFRSGVLYDLSRGHKPS